MCQLHSSWESDRCTKVSALPAASSSINKPHKGASEPEPRVHFKPHKGLCSQIEFQGSCSHIISMIPMGNRLNAAVAQSLAYVICLPRHAENQLRRPVWEMVGHSYLSGCHHVSSKPWTPTWYIEEFLTDLQVVNQSSGKVILNI